MDFYIVLAMQHSIITFAAFLSPEEQTRREAELDERQVEYRAFTFHLAMNLVTRKLITSAMPRIERASVHFFEAASKHLCSLLQGEEEK